MSAAVRCRNACFFLTAILVVSIPLCAGGPEKKSVDRTPILEYHSVVPMGALVYNLKPTDQPFYVEVSAVNQEFDGWRVVNGGGRNRLLDSSGATPTVYPSQLAFRVVASARSKTLRMVTRNPVRAACSLNDYLLGLAFRLKIFRGVNSADVRPIDVRPIGVAPSVPFNERVYLVSFDVKDVPISDRVVLELLAPTGERIGKFHLDLY